MSKGACRSVEWYNLHTLQFSLTRMSHCVCFQVPTGEHFSLATIAVTTLVDSLGVPVGFSPLSRSAVGPNTGLCNVNRLYPIFLSGAVTLGPQQLSKAPVTPQICPIGVYHAVVSLPV